MKEWDECVCEWVGSRKRRVVPVRHVRAVEEQLHAHVVVHVVDSDK